MSRETILKQMKHILTAIGQTPKSVKTAVRFLLTAAILIILFRQVSWHAMWSAVRSIDSTVFIAALLLWIPTQWFQFLRWDYLARQAGPDVSRLDIHKGYWVGFTLGLLTPGRIGEYGRALALHNCQLSRAIGLTVVERHYSAFILNGFGLLGIVILPLSGWQAPYPSLGIAITLILIVLGLLNFWIGIYPRMILNPLKWLVRKLPLREKLERAVEVLRPIGPRQGSLLMFLAAAGLISSALQFILILRAMGVAVPIGAGLLAVLMNFFFKGMLPISIGSLGIGEWTAMLCLTGFGVDPAFAVAASLLLFLINVFLPSLIGLPFVTSLRMPLKSNVKALASP